MALCPTGLLTSVHCMAMCGGLNLSQSMKRGEQSSWRNSVLYNMGRVCSYTLTGALLGALGSVVSISVEVRAGIGLFAGIRFIFRVQKGFSQDRLLGLVCVMV